MLKTIKKSSFPQIPSCKTYYYPSSTLEHDVIIKCLNPDLLLTLDDEAILKESIQFYENLFTALKEVPLSNITIEESEHLISYLNLVFTIAFPVANDLEIKRVHRVTIIEEKYLEKGKIRHPKFLTHPPLSVISASKKYNRGNSFSTTVFYAAFNENVAIRETKPEKGKRIIISKWEPKSNKPFISYPITNSEINNEEVKKSTAAFKKTVASYNPLFAKILDLNIGFLASEFVKDIPIKHPNRLEYLYSAYFADKTFVENPAELKMQNFDLIIYPSVAYKHLESNIAMHPNSLKKMKIVHALEYEVEETYYAEDIDVEVFPAKLKFIRESTWFDENQILWEDD
jgi:hypothetical protein